MSEATPIASETVDWYPVDAPLDDEQTVQISLDRRLHSEPTWLEYRIGVQWFDVGGMPIEGVLAFAPTLKGVAP
jgi:hypothetical protein